MPAAARGEHPPAPRATGAAPMAGAIVTAWQPLATACSPRPPRARSAALAAGCLAAAGRSPAPVPRAPAPQPPHAGTPTAQALLRSRELWATIDVCNPPDQPNTVGIRGSMPGDGKPADKLYMSFRLQYLDAVNQWAALPLRQQRLGARRRPAPAPRARAGGASRSKPPPRPRQFVLRGVVDFQWTRAGHQFAHADAADDRRAQERSRAPTRRASAPPAAAL